MNAEVAEVARQAVNEVFTWARQLFKRYADFLSLDIFLASERRIRESAKLTGEVDFSGHLVSPRASIASTHATHMAATWISSLRRFSLTLL